MWGFSRNLFDDLFSACRAPFLTALSGESPVEQGQPIEAIG